MNCPLGLLGNTANSLGIVGNPFSLGSWQFPRPRHLSGIQSPHAMELSMNCSMGFVGNVVNSQGIVRIYFHTAEIESSIFLEVSYVQGMFWDPIPQGKRVVNKMFFGVSWQWCKLPKLLLEFQITTFEHGLNIGNNFIVSRVALGSQVFVTIAPCKKAFMI